MNTDVTNKPVGEVMQQALYTARQCPQLGFKTKAGRVFLQWGY